MVIDEKMTAYEAWNQIIAILSKEPCELSTVPIVKRQPVWFCAKTDGTYIYLSPAKVHKPSSRLTKTQRLSFEHSFLKIYPLYFYRVNGETVSKEANSISVNTTYYYSLIEHLVAQTI